MWVASELRLSPEDSKLCGNLLSLGSTASPDFFFGVLAPRMKICTTTDCLDQIKS